MATRKKDTVVTPAVDPLSKQTEIGNLIQVIEDAVRRVDGWVNTHLPEAAEDVRDLLVRTRTRLGEEIGLKANKEGALVHPETAKKADSALNADGSAKDSSNKPQASTASPAPFDVTQRTNEDTIDQDVVGRTDATQGVTEATTTNEQKPTSQTQKTGDANSDKK